MNKTVISFAAMFVVAVFLSACDSQSGDHQNTSDVRLSEASRVKTEQAIRAANDSLYAGLNAMFTGDLEALNNLWSHTETITQMGPFGGRVTGWSDVHEQFKKNAAMKLGGKIVCKDVHVFAGTDMGYTVCVEEGENMGSDGKPVVVSHRATNIFHLEDGRWRLVHHQTDISPQLEKAFQLEKK